ncbi:MAG: NADH:ubiquinone reductase (Na(+)-transporting) subunit F [Candidatus Marinimicrobia bacterium]|jgi:Na+-transporting NADH:ubiquinone oxidoreductase subunit F|nr:NADH:ubiquinone reductase (Na(+)-transporting) subunit F [Candidatus Neomarinimicrobiota bacterium]MBT3826000.1 NADH:ubiquinone reductase (Na(+)-transporting) subunit F [Candidatus Neomarinimicrobiota bacterium]MBT4131902.1 NADH:ubiquinone reductase (Na(+)-transporting) subunit F [Candidatus Neomarinimicrobiota bacterium]MBT4295999.1 NADH:ubiquinone reductase (Na(+)-transporting) subunit F [Candidatus Neomarinimicrobiota bacterium]MBT4420508.1 NADH:ubiquinone reductase (Na(+)-transporting) s
MSILGLILLSTLVFTGTILILVVILNYATSKLVPAGDVKILINGDEEKSVTSPAGQTLLQTLAAEKIFLPSACGGGGTCGMCTCQIDAGGGEILPTEKPHLTRSEIKDNVRLTCQVKVKSDMDIRIPDEIFNIQKWECEVVSNENVATFIKEFIVRLPEGENLDFRAGGYIQIDIPPHKLDYSEFAIEDEYRGDWDKFNMWRYSSELDETIFRAYSMANHPAEGNIVMLNVRIASPPPGMDVPPGLASSYIFNLKPGDKVVVSGPYGEFFAKETEREMLYIGGGAGMAPMRSHIFDLLKTKHTTRRISFWYGARSKREMFYDDEFKALAEEFPNFSYHVALSDPMEEDNWDGPVGFIHQVVADNYLTKHEAPEDIEYYMCGPPMMVDAVDNMLYNMGVEKEMIDYDSF